MTSFTTNKGNQLNLPRKGNKFGNYLPSKQVTFHTRIFAGIEPKDLMLFDFDGHLVDVVRERPYRNVLTVRASSHKALKAFRTASSADMVKVPHHLYPFIIHIDEDSSPLNITYPTAKSIEVVDRLTPEPACFIYEYCYVPEDGDYIGDYGYCWPYEVESTTDYLMTGEKELVGEPVFLPLFKIPGELVGAPIKILEGEFEVGDIDFPDEDDSEN